MQYEVLLTGGAERELEEIYDYIAEFDSSTSADYVLDQILLTADKLETFPERGSISRELQVLGIQDYRQVYFKSYRIIYSIVEFQVHISLIVDGRRDMTSLLLQRLLNTTQFEKELASN